jgi:hypothetical protein
MIGHVINAFPNSLPGYTVRLPFLVGAASKTFEIMPGETTGGDRSAVEVSPQRENHDTDLKSRRSSAFRLPTPFPGEPETGSQRLSISRRDTPTLTGKEDSWERGTNFCSVFWSLRFQALRAEQQGALISQAHVGV